jgi:hypothetical protein
MFRLEEILPNRYRSYMHPLTKVLEALKWTSILLIEHPDWKLIMGLQRSPLYKPETGR